MTRYDVSLCNLTVLFEMTPFLFISSLFHIIEEWLVINWNILHSA